METAFCQSCAQGSRFLASLLGAALGEGVECGVGGVAEGTQHAGDVFQGDCLARRSARLRAGSPSKSRMT